MLASIANLCILVVIYLVVVHIYIYLCTSILLCFQTEAKQKVFFFKMVQSPKDFQAFCLVVRYT